ncbi:MULTISPECIES: hypothetical protein [unclassified Escherichia]|nr:MULTISPECIES: hypothetical protein [unclassified Escherichia]
MAEKAGPARVTADE